MKNKLLSSMATIPLIVAGIVTGTNVANGATLGSRIEFSGYVFGSLNQMDYIDLSASPLAPSPNVLGNFQVNDATGSFAPALTNPSRLGTIRDFTEGNTSGIINQTGPVLDSSDHPAFYISDFIRLNVPGLVNFTFQLETVDRTVGIDPNSPNPADPLITGISGTLTGTLTDLITNEVQAAVGTFVPNFPAGITISQFTPDNFLGPASFNGSLEVVSAPTSIPEPRTNAGLALFGFLGLGYMVKLSSWKNLKI
ncbi:hypothetical protein [Moorena sp. SIOASIH]|uniref:hypothetical protein n=1 Tax=Moorena sp. SIOASIH TaxID=2607817 RepID=UPI0025FE7E3E|nr:hypothetical protein [Moorena sp. SIOASIH]